MCGGARIILPQTNIMIDHLMTENYTLTDRQLLIDKRSTALGEIFLSRS